MSTKARKRKIRKYLESQTIFDGPSTFRGYAGEAALSIFRWHSFFTYVPIMLLYYGLWNLEQNISLALHPLVAVALLLFLLGLFIGRFATAAAEGELDAGFFNQTSTSKATIFFALRYVAYSAIWLSFIYILYVFLIGADQPFPPKLTGASFLQLAALDRNVLFILFLYLIFDATLVLSAIQAVENPNVQAIWNPNAWWRILISRGGDLVFLLALIIGAFGLFLVFLSFILFFLISLVESTSPTLADDFKFLYLMLPLAALPAFIGRVVGAYKYGSDSLDDWQEFVFKDAEAETSVEEDIDSNAADNDSKSIAKTNIYTYTGNVSEEFHVLIKKELVKQESVFAAYIFSQLENKPNSPFTLGIHLLDSTPIAVRQGIIDELTNAIRFAPSVEDRCHVVLVEDNELARAEKIGQRVYCVD